MKKYFPILLSKEGELTALKHLPINIKKEICPIIQYLPGNHDKLEHFLSNEWNFQDNLIFIDFFIAQNFASITKGNITKFINSCRSNGCNVGLCIRPGMGTKYLTFVKSMLALHSIDITIIIPIQLMHNIDTEARTLLDSLSLNESDCRILLDGNYVNKTNHNGIAAVISLGMSKLMNYNDWKNVIIGSGSFPINLTEIVPAGRKHLLRRYEVDIWNAAQATREFNSKTKYCDYGIKNPEYSDAAFTGTCSIKYTNATDFVIYRGELSGNHRDGNGQYVTFAKQLVSSSDFPSRTFSWGDEEIYQKSLQTLGAPKIKTGNAGSWVKYGQNHHLTLLHSIL